MVTIKYFSRQFIILTICTLIVLTLMMYASATVSYNYALTTEKGKVNADNTRQRIDSIRQTITVQDIFINNFLIGIPLLIPITGFLFFGKILLNTGATLGYLSAAYHVTPEILMVNVYVPIGIIENLAYSILIVESLLIIHVLLKHNLMKRLKHQTWKSLLLYLALLAFGALLEVILINL